MATLPPFEKTAVWARAALSGLPPVPWVGAVEAAARQLEARLPAGEQVLFELRDNGGAADVALGLDARRGAVARAMRDAPGWGPHRAVLDRSAGAVWLEVDAAQWEGDRPVPGIFWQGGPALLTAFGLGHLAEAVSVPGPAEFLGVFPARAQGGVRVCLSMPPDRLDGVAQRLGLPVAPWSRIRDAAAGGTVRLSLDAGEVIGPRIGVDIPVRTPGDLARVARCMPGILPDLPQIGRWCGAAPGLDALRADEVVPDPVPGRAPVWVRRLNHVKITVESGRIGAKIYLFLGLGWPHSASAARVIEQASSSRLMASSITSSAKPATSM
ncbi:hypothetical protein [Salipiger sp.]|uniref:hypothetical protein n=1 Tax=Salipiger sp. TaxID=2078585 RepID=UPI003A984F00